MSGERAWTVTHYDRPFSLNRERNKHWAHRHELTTIWRDAFCILAKQAKIPHLERASIVAMPHQRNGTLADAGNHYPSVKAAIDGLVLAGVLDDDSPAHLAAITFVAPVRGVDALTLKIVDQED